MGMNVDKAGREGQSIACYALERIAPGKVTNQGNLARNSRYISNIWSVAKPIIDERTLENGL